MRNFYAFVSIILSYPIYMYLIKQEMSVDNIAHLQGIQCIRASYQKCNKHAQLRPAAINSISGL